MLGSSWAYTSIDGKKMGVVVAVAAVAVVVAAVLVVSWVPEVGETRATLALCGVDIDVQFALPVHLPIE